MIMRLLLICALTGAAFGQGVVTAPAGNQTIAQPDGTTFTPSSLGFVLYADKCPGTDIGMKINACAAKLPISGGYHVGTIILPNTSNDTADAVWATTVHIGPGVNLTGQGLLASSFHCTVAGDCLVHDESAASGVYAHTTGVTSVYQGFTITGNGVTAQNIFHFKDAVNLTVRDVGADGATAAGSACFLLHDVKYWTERNTFENVSTLYGCAIGWRFITDTGNKYNPHPSFGYNRFLDIKANPNNGQTAFSFEGNSYIYDCTFRMTINADQNAQAMIHMQDAAWFYENELHMFGEGSMVYTLDIGAKNQFTYVGQINVGPQTNHFAAGSVVTRWGDDGGYGPDIQTDFFNAIRWGKPVVLASRTNLNNVAFCGTYTGANLVNAPAVLGTANIKIEVICTSAAGYVTQIAYQMEFAGLRDPATASPRVFQRVQHAGAWAPWREMAWVDQAPLTGTTGALPRAAIAAASCTNLTASITGATSSMTVSATPASTTQLIAGLHWDTAYVSAAGTVTVPVCNTTASPITPNITPTFNVRLIP
jgi:hypothetical protein